MADIAPPTALRPPDGRLSIPPGATVGHEWLVVGNGGVGDRLALRLVSPFSLRLVRLDELPLGMQRERPFLLPGEGAHLV